MIRGDCVHTSPPDSRRGAVGVGHAFAHGVGLGEAVGHGYATAEIPAQEEAGVFPLEGLDLRQQPPVTDAVLGNNVVGNDSIITGMLIGPEGVVPLGTTALNNSTGEFNRPWLKVTGG